MTPASRGALAGIAVAFFAMWGAAALGNAVTPAPVHVQPSAPVGRDLPLVADRSRPLRAVTPTPRHRPQGLNWTALVQCESSGNPRAVSRSGTYRGLVQFDLETWHSLDLTGDPIDYPASVQLAAAQRLYNLRGREPWPVCGRRL